MPLNRAALHATDKLRRAPIKDKDGKPIPGAFIYPELAEDEYIEILHVRDFPRDMAADMASQRQLPPIPLVGETAAQTASREPTIRRDEAAYGRAVWEYMCVRLHVRDADTGVWMDGGDDGTPEQWRGTKKDRDDIWSAWGPYLSAEFQPRFGSVAPLIKEGEVDAQGKPLTFLQTDRPGAAAVPATTVPGSKHPDRARARA